MIKLLQSGWFSALAGTLMYLGTTVALWKTPVIPPPPKAEEGTAVFGASGPLAPSWEFHNPEMDELVADIKGQKKTLDLREGKLNELQARLDLERAEIGAVTQRVAQLQQQFDRSVVLVQTGEAVNLKKLAKIYATMTPEAVAAVFKELKDDEVVKILSFMKETESAQIMELLAKQGSAQAKRAATISERMRVVVARAGNEKPKL